jgi:two-component system, NarL family, sensor kinase
MKQVLWVWLLFFVTGNTFAQKDRIQFKTDSLIAVADDSPDDSVQCMRYCDISNLYRQLDPKTSVNWAEKAISLSSKLHFLMGLQCAYNNLGISLYMQGKHPEAIDAFKAYKAVCSQLHDSVNIAWGYNNIGNVYIDLTAYDQTLLYYDSALSIRQKLNDSNAIAQSLVNFGYIHKELGLYTEALVDLYGALKILEPLGNETTLAYCYDFLGIVYSLRHNPAYSNYFYKKALHIYSKQNQRSGEAIALNTIGNNYYSMGQKSLGKKYIQQAYSIYRELDDKRQLAIVTSTLSEWYTNENKPDSALLFAKQSIEYHRLSNTHRQLGAAYLKLAKAHQMLNHLAEAISAAEIAYSIVDSSGERNSQKEALQLLNTLYAQQGDYAKAYTYQRLYIALNDSMVNEAGEKAIADMQTKYETGQKDLEIEKQGLEIRRQQTQLLLAILSIITILIISIAIYNRYKLKQQNILSAALLEEQSIRNKAIIEAEEKERIRIARELHDGIGQQLSAAKMNLSAFESSVSEQDKDRYQNMVQLVDDAVKEVRTVSHNMMPNALIRSGLSSAIRDFVHKISSTDALKVDLQIVGLNTRLESTTETVLYRVLQECVSNIVKHAGASHISIQLIQHDKHLSMMVEDNGKGFDTTLVNQAEGIGLKNMVSRVQFLNGTIDFDSTPGKGTTVIIDIPL